MIRKDQNKKEKYKWSKNILFVGSVLLLGSVATTLFYLNSRVANKSIIYKERAGNNLSVGETADKSSKRTITYKSEMFKYSVSYPDTLTVWEIGSGGGYIDFVRFEETGKSSFKGFAIGVSELSIENEVTRIKKSFESEDAFFSEETQVDFKGLKAKQLYYKPQKVDDGEDRLVVIFNNGKYTYSISTVPWQVNEILGRFEFLN